jgi:hypothetical protein
MILLEDGMLDSELSPKLGSLMWHPHSQKASYFLKFGYLDIPESFPVSKEAT